MFYKKFHKKGFTIVELVIVIAVIAILAAILIPMFINVTKRANLSADQQSVYEMNLALAIDEAENEKQSDVQSMIEHMDGEGYNFSYYHPLTKDHDFFWNKKLNRIVLIDTSKPEIVYPDEYKEDITRDDLVTDISEIEQKPNALYFSLSMVDSSAEVLWEEVSAEKVQISTNGEITSIDATGITYLKIPATINGQKVTKIGELPEHGASQNNDKTFLNASGVKRIYIPDSVTAIGNQAFCGLTSLEYLEIPDGVALGGYLFQDNSSLKELVIGHNITTIDPSLSIGSCFANCTALETVTMYSDLGYDKYNQTVGKGIFENYTSLKNVTLGDGVRYIANEAFKNCTALKNIIIPKTVLRIEKDAFKNSGLESVTFENQNGWSAYYSVYAQPDKVFESSEIKDSGVAAGYLSDTYAYRIWICTVTQ